MGNVDACQSKKWGWGAACAVELEMGCCMTGLRPHQDHGNLHPTMYYVQVQVRSILSMYVLYIVTYLLLRNKMNGCCYQPQFG